MVVSFFKWEWEFFQFCLIPIWFFFDWSTGIVVCLHLLPRPGLSVPVTFFPFSYRLSVSSRAKRVEVESKWGMDVFLIPEICESTSYMWNFTVGEIIIIRLRNPESRTVFCLPGRQSWADQSECGTSEGRTPNVRGVLDELHKGLS